MWTEQNDKYINEQQNQKDMTHCDTFIAIEINETVQIKYAKDAAVIAITADILIIESVILSVEFL